MRITQITTRMSKIPVKLIWKHSCSYRGRKWENYIIALSAMFLMCTQPLPLYYVIVINALIIKTITEAVQMLNVYDKHKTYFVYSIVILLFGENRCANRKIYEYAYSNAR